MTENERPNHSRKQDDKPQEKKGSQTTTENLMAKHSRKQDAKPQQEMGC